MVSLKAANISADERKLVVIFEIINLQFDLFSVIYF